jgi:hypothetical protein
MKGTCYSGIVFLPSHPLADMHGLLRACVRTRGRLQVGTLLDRAGIMNHPSFWLTGMWCESKSAVEQHVTEKHYGEILVCSLVQAYLKPEVYEVVRESHV